ncbi:MAG: dTDP-4-dehydrorhamnose reductase [Burkholderiales bacterium]|nr:dTDP-4-dehydrorhamnose reductase [Burkholderiales bacterium]
MSRILLTGKNGQVGFELQRRLARLGRVTATGREEMDLANPDSIRNMVRNIAPNLIVNAAAYTAVDQAESEPERALAINGVAPGILAEEAKRLGAVLIHYSTDYVFDGTKAVPYAEDDEPRPLSAYGRSKLAGEQAIQAVDLPHLILRTSWVYGARGKNFMLTILRLAKDREELTVVNDQVGSPTWCQVIAAATGGVLESLRYGQAEFREACAAKRGIYHLTASGQTSWHGFAAAILANAAIAAPGKSGFALARVPKLKPITTEQFPLPAQRPRNSLLSNTKIQTVFGLAMPGWESSLADCMRSDKP